MSYRQLVSLFCAALLLSACSSQPKNDYDLNFDFTQLTHFSQLASPPTDDPLSAQRIQTDISQQLNQKGFIELTHTETQTADKTADFLVTYAINTTDKPKDSGLSIGLGTGTFGSSGGIGVGTSVGVPLGSDTAKVQTIQIDILDPSGKRLIWRGSDSYDFDMGGNEKAQETTKAVSRILAQFPPQKK